MSNTHCPMIHGGLQINLKRHHSNIFVNQCCLRNDLTVAQGNVWDSSALTPLRELNKEDKWSPGCWTCHGNELAGMSSLRTGMLEKFGIRTGLAGPQRLDLMFDIGCNLACRTCGPSVSTFWQKHMKDNGLAFNGPKPQSRVDDMIAILKTLDLSNLEMVVFCGGETLLGQGYWQVAEAIADMVPNTKDRVTLSFQTNGTQPISERNYKTIERFSLVKLNISLDAVGNRFEYLRWPAKWDHVTENIKTIRDSAPVNVMFLIEETISIFNLYYQNELDHWIKEQFATNRLGDPVTHTRHAANGIFSLDHLSKDYLDSIPPATLKQLVKPGWKENTGAITSMLAEINKFDALRAQDWTTTFPEVAGFYKKFATAGI